MTGMISAFAHVGRLVGRAALAAAGDVAREAGVTLESEDVASGGGGGRRHVLRVGDRSVAFETSSAPACAAVGLLRRRDEGGVTVSACVPGAGAGVGVAFEPVQWMDWSAWASDPKNTVGAREWLLLATRGGFAWHRGVRPNRSLMFSSRNTSKSGYMTWERAVLGRRHDRFVDRSKPIVGSIQTHEGAYAAAAQRIVTESWRSRFPLRTRTVTWCFTSETGVPMPAPPREPGGPVEERLRSMFEVEGHETIDQATAALRRAILAERFEVGGPTWTPALRLREKGKARAPRYAAGGPPAAAGGPVTWESRDPLTGTWSDWGVRRREELPPGVILESDPMPSWLTSVLFLGGAVAMFGKLADSLDRA